MQHFPIFLAVAGRRIVISGGGDAAMAKLRLLLKTEAHINVFAKNPIPEIETLATQGRLTLIRRPLDAGDALCAALFYAANDDDTEDARAIALARADGALTNWVDNLEQSAFITPAIVDRDPVTVAIGTEGAAPVLARSIKADLEERLPPSLGTLARIGKAFRKQVEALPLGRIRRDFWSSFYFDVGPKAQTQGETAVQEALEDLLSKRLAAQDEPGRVAFVGSGPGDPELLTLKARKALHDADVVITDRLVTPEILELARREALIIDAGKEGFGPSMKQDDINALIVEHARNGSHVVRLKSGDPTVFGRLGEEVDACVAADVDFTVVPGITAASAAVASIGQSLTKRNRNSAVRFATGHDMKGYAEQDWRSVAEEGAVTAIYMGKKSARFVQGRLLMHGASATTPVTVIENASRPDQRVLTTHVAAMATDIANADMPGPALTFIGLAPRAAVAQASDILEEIAL